MASALEFCTILSVGAKTEALGCKAGCLIPSFLPVVFRQFSFLLGTDTYQDLRKGKWRKSAELMKMVSVVIVDSEYHFPPRPVAGCLLRLHLFHEPNA